jgi:hypothetical protein
VVRKVFVLLAASLVTVAASRGFADEWSDAELKRIEGRYERTVFNQAGTMFRVVKEVVGDAEIVTNYDDVGNVIDSHRASIKVEKRGSVRVFSFFNAVVTHGANKGATQAGTNSYVYRCDNDTFVEAWGMLEGDPNRPRMNIWQKIKTQ